MTPFLSRRAPADPALTETIQRGVQYLAFRLVETGMVASFDPGTARAPVLVARAALAAVMADETLAHAGETAQSPAARAALRARNALAGQLADLRAHRGGTAQISGRQRYLEALAAFLIADGHLAEASAPAAIAADQTGAASALAG